MYRSEVFSMTGTYFWFILSLLSGLNFKKWLRPVRSSDITSPSHSNIFMIIYSAAVWYPDLSILYKKLYKRVTAVLLSGLKRWKTTKISKDRSHHCTYTVKNTTVSRFYMWNTFPLIWQICTDPVQLWTYEGIESKIIQKTEFYSYFVLKYSVCVVPSTLPLSYPVWIKVFKEM